MPLETLYRPVAAELEIMRAEQGGSDGRTVFGILVPWNHPMRIDEHLREQFEPGGADHVITAGERGRAPGGLPAYRMHFAREHVRQGGHPIGRTQLLRDDAAGLYGEWRVSATPVGDETIELIKDGVYRELSVGFRSSPQWERRLPDGTVSRTRFDPFEAAVVLRGAYADAAAVAGVRAEDEAEAEHERDERTRLDHARSVLAGWPMIAPPGVSLRADDPRKPYGDVTYADPGYQKDHKKRYPVDTKDHALAAWSYINQQGNAAKYGAQQLKAVKGRIRAALKRFGVSVEVNA
jgi:HK97 family phage prohead protease